MKTKQLHSKKSQSLREYLRSTDFVLSHFIFSLSVTHTEEGVFTNVELPKGFSNLGHRSCLKPLWAPTTFTGTSVEYSLIKRKHSTTHYLTLLSLEFVGFMSHCNFNFFLKKKIDFSLFLLGFLRSTLLVIKVYKNRECFSSILWEKGIQIFWRFLQNQLRKRQRLKPTETDK